ncbi:MAG: hypothetical protein UV54_C0042G0001, partial [Candidatus Beckwithbacteria bacterium GW2011_GWA2_43_10]
ENHQAEMREIKNQIKRDSGFIEFGQGLQYLLALVSPELRVGKTKETLEEELKKLKTDHPAVYKVANALAMRAYGEFSGKIKELNLSRDNLETAVEKLPLLERMAVGLGINGEFMVALEGEGIQPVIEGLLPVAGFTRLIPGLEFSAFCHRVEGKEEVLISVRLGQMKEKKKGEQAFEGISFDFTLGNGKQELVRSGNLVFSNDLPGQYRILVNALKIQDKINEQTANFHYGLNTWIIHEMQKRDIQVGGVTAEIKDGKMKLTVKKK